MCVCEIFREVTEGMPEHTSQEVYCHISMSSGAVLCLILIGRIRESAGQHFSYRDRRRVGRGRAERRNH